MENRLIVIKNAASHLGRKRINWPEKLMINSFWPNG